MNVREEFLSTYKQLPVRAQILFLARLAQNWNVRARDTYGAGTDINEPEKLRKFNEAQNRALSQLIKLLANSDERYPDTVFCNILIDQCEILESDPRMLIELARALLTN